MERDRDVGSMVEMALGQSERAKLDIRLKNCDAEWEGAVVDDDAHTLLLQLGGLPAVTAFTTHVVASEDGGVGFSGISDANVKKSKKTTA